MVAVEPATVLFATALATAVAGAAVAGLAYRGYRRNDSEAMLYLAIGIACITVAPFVVSYGVAPIATLSDAGTLLGVLGSNIVGCSRSSTPSRGPDLAPPLSLSPFSRVRCGRESEAVPSTIATSSVPPAQHSRRTSHDRPPRRYLALSPSRRVDSTESGFRGLSAVPSPGEFDVTPTPTDRRRRELAPTDAVRTLLGAPFDPWTYRSLAYLLLAFPLGIAYFVAVVTGLSVSLGLSVTWLGPILFVVTLLTILSLAWLDAVVTRGLLVADVSPGFPDTDDGVLAFAKQLVLGRRTWLGAVYLLWKFVLGTVAFAVIVTGLSLAGSLLTTPFVYGDALVVEYWVFAYGVDTLGRALVAAVGGLLVGLATLSLANLMGRLAAVVAEGLLTHDE